jgi:hypothetical protein
MLSLAPELQAEITQPAVRDRSKALFRIIAKMLEAGLDDNTDLRKFLDTSVLLSQAAVAGSSYGAAEAGAQPTAQSERIKA